MNGAGVPSVWFPTIRAGSGTDIFTERLAAGLQERGIRAEITWLPLHAEFAPWTVAVPRPPIWANVVHVNTWLPPRFIPTSLPVVATIHHAIHHPDTLAYKGTLRAAYHHFWIVPNECRVLKRANRVVAVSKFVAETASGTLLDVPMDVIYNGVNTDVFRPSDRRRTVDGTFRLLYVGKWTPLKGVHLLASIMRELGEGFDLRYTGGRAADHDKRNMPNNMYDIGRLTGEHAVVAAMHEADAFLFPSRSEGHPLAVAEAMACGLPVIAVHGSSLAELVDDGATGVLCPRDDVAAFALAIKRVAMDAVHRRAMSGAARHFAIRRLSQDTMVEAYINLYRGISAG